ncbi:hypothetical protein B0H67DRAFT_222770 [Lasiosphaeris hirsuta]|uniref:GATA-type domain-containing protein n=1 Tax=Lasiosphaeris hirsuta TaxID=260670 RepID=A0AA40DSR6_9PEZI|nr:hypothetical protein B0H67DRAFT_222770 [Lasiosphaeris hirsuta]
MGDGPVNTSLPAKPDPEPISRPSSTSTQGSVPHGLPNLLPGFSSLSTGAPVTNSPQPRPLAIAPAMYPAGTSPASTHPNPGGSNGATPTCQNCTTTTTPLWRRDEMGAVLCNACGLFLKLHGRPRPISLKTDVIKSRNRVKTIRPDLAKQKKGNGVGAANMGARRASHRSANGNGDDHSPISRTGTPNMYNVQIYQNLDDQFQSQQLPGFGVSAASPGRAPSPMNGERLDLPQTHEQLIAVNSSLKTRVSELEVIQELYRGRIQQLEQEESVRQVQDAGKADEQLRSQVAILGESNSQLQKELEESHRRENMLKRRLDELEVELKDVRDSLETHENGRAKRQRLDDDATKPIDDTTTPKSES